MNGGLGNDILLGSEGDDLFNGGDGNDVAFMGAGDDTFVWNPGDDNDTLEGQAGFDTMLFNGANAAENINIVANGGRVLFTRDIANVADGPERRRGRSTSTPSAAPTRSVVNDLSGTDVTNVDIDLAAAAGGGADNQPDTIIIDATNGDDVIQIVGDGNGGSPCSASLRPGHDRELRRATTGSSSTVSAATT